MVNILIDSSSSRVTGNGWVSFPTGQNLGGSVSRYNGTGTSISLFVVTALLSGADIPTSSTVNIDGSQSWNVSIDRGDNATLLVERQWFTTPVLPDATHTVSITNFPRNFSLNYALVRPGSNTPLDGELLIVDDEDPAIGYMGTWDQNTGTIVIPVAGPINLLEFLPVNGATRSALSIIDTLQVAEFNFTGQFQVYRHLTVDVQINQYELTPRNKGTSIYVYGILGGSETGSETISVNFTLDDVDSPQVYHPPAQTQANFLWFSNNNLSFGSHRLQITPTHFTTIPFQLDYILYTQANYVIPSDGPFIPADANSNGSGNNGASHAKGPPTSTVIGAAVGGIVGLLLTLLVFLFRKRIFASRCVSKLSVSEKREPISPTAVALRQGNGADSEDMIHSPVPGGQSLLDISPFPPPNDTDTSVELIPHRLEPQRMSVPNHELIVIPEVEVPQQSPLQQLIRALRLSQDRQSSAVFAGSTNLLTDDEFIDVAVTPFSVPLDRVPEENIHHINARLQQLQAIAMDIQREIAETQSIPSDVPVQLAPPTESPSRSNIGSRMTSPRPASLYPPPNYDQTEEGKDERIRQFLAATL